MAFETDSAEIYDVLYHDKDYEREVDFIEHIFKDFSQKPVKTVLDGGCGTGGHIFSLARHGYQVTGVDLSPAMLKRAGEKARENGLNIDLHAMDLRRLELGKRFDACLIMFNVIGYITSNSDIVSTLENVKRHLKENSLFVFDCWNGLTVLRMLPSARVKTVEKEGLRITRFATSELDAFNHTCKVNYRIFMHRSDNITSEFKETHIVRYFFPQEIIFLLETAGFKVLKVCPFLDVNGKVDETIWNMSVISRAK